MTDPTDNPLELDGFEFVEFTSPNPARMVHLLEQLGFTAQSKHPTRDIVRYKQGRINLLVNREATGQGAEFRRAHGPSANGMAFRVANAAKAFAMALERGAKAADPGAGALGPDARVLQGIGGSLLYLVDRHGEKGTVYDSWTPIPGAEEAEARNSAGLLMLDHLTHNVRRGEMRTWSSFYNRVFGFTEQKYFDIKGQATGLFSQAMIAPDRAIRIPLNESQDEHSQIEEFLRQYNGEGIQHLALTTDDIYGTVERLRKRGVVFQDTIETYYELVDQRVPGHGEDLERMRQNRILIDGNRQEGLLLQIFTENLFGPIFFEIIQRKGNEGFGNGNFQALFESIELDQIRRGVIKVDPLITADPGGAPAGAKKSRRVARLADNMLQNRPVTLRPLAPLSALVALLAAASPARAACLAARGGPSVGGLSATWKTAVEQLLRSTSEPGHPWSCVGGVVDLEVASSGAVLRVAREGEEAVARRVESPEDVVPLGQALLATPLPPPPPPPPESVVSAPPSSPEPAVSAASPAPASAPSEQPSVRPSRLLVGGGVDVHHVGGSRVAWVGPVASAAVPMGRWLPGISVRYQSSVLSRRPPIDEVSVAVSVLSRFALSAVELRAGLVLRGATVQRDLPRPQGDQGRLEGRVGAITSLVIPAFRWGRVVLSADAEVVGAVRERDTQLPPGVDPPRPYPRYLLGGGAQIEVPL